MVNGVRAGYDGSAWPCPAFTEAGAQVSHAVKFNSNSGAIVGRAEQLVGVTLREPSALCALETDLGAVTVVGSKADGGGVGNGTLSDVLDVGGRVNGALSGGS